MLQDHVCSPSKGKNKVTSQGRRPDGYYEASKTNKENLQTDSLASTGLGIGMSCLMAAKSRMASFFTLI